MIYLLVFGLLWALGVTGHEYIRTNNNLSIGYSLFQVYLFHATFSFLLCSVFQILSQGKKWQSQLGFLYLGTLIVKLLLFSAIFSATLFSEELLSYSEKLSLLIPVFIFLLPEVYFVYKILMKIDLIKN